MTQFVVGMKDQVTSSAKSAANSLGELAEALGIAGAAATAAIVVFVAVAAALVAMGGISIAAASFKRDTLASFEALTGSAAEGQKALDVINELRKRVPETEEELVARAKGLLTAGLNPADVKQALLAMSAATAAGIEGAPKALEKVIGLTMANNNRLKVTLKDLKNLGITEDELAKALGMDPKGIAKAMANGAIEGDKGIDAITNILRAKGEKALESKMLDPGVMFDKFKNGLFHLFDEVGDTPGYKEFIDALQGMLAAFGEGSAAGKGMKTGITSSMGVLFSVAAKGVRLTTIGFLNIYLAALKLYIFLFPLIKKTHEVFNVLGGWDTLGKLIKILGAVVLFTLSPFIVMAGVFMAMGAAIIYLIDLIAPTVKKIATAIGGAIETFAGYAKKAYNTGRDFVSSIILGMSDAAEGIPAVGDKVGQAMQKGVKAALKQHSPSKVGIDIGSMFGTSIAMGMDKSANDVGASATGLAAAAIPEGSSGPKGGGGTVTINVGGITITGAGGDVLSLTEEAVALVFERYALEQGLLAAG